MTTSSFVRVVFKPKGEFHSTTKRLEQVVFVGRGEKQRELGNRYGLGTSFPPLA